MTQIMDTSQKTADNIMWLLMTISQKLQQEFLTTQGSKIAESALDMRQTSTVQLDE